MKTQTIKISIYIYAYILFYQPLRLVLLSKKGLLDRTTTHIALEVNITFAIYYIQIYTFRNNQQDRFTLKALLLITNDN